MQTVGYAGEHAPPPPPVPPPPDPAGVPAGTPGPPHAPHRPAPASRARRPRATNSSAWATFGGVTVPSSGHAGWHHGTDRWPEGIFFRFELTALELA